MNPGLAFFASRLPHLSAIESLLVEWRQRLVVIAYHGKTVLFSCQRSFTVLALKAFTRLATQSQKDVFSFPTPHGLAVDNQIELPFIVEPFRVHDITRIIFILLLRFAEFERYPDKHNVYPKQKLFDLNIRN